MKKILVLMLALALVFSLCACTIPEVQVRNADGTQTVWGVLIEQTITTVARVLESLVLIYGAWALDKFGKNTKLKNLNIANQRVCEIVQQTVHELNQTIVTDLKAASPDGKLTQDQIDDLGFRMLALVKLKLDEATKDLLIAAGADLDALITGECEGYLDALKAGLELETVE